MTPLAQPAPVTGLEAVVFDLDGTLLDHQGAARDGVAAWLAAQGVCVDDALIAEWFELERRHLEAWHRGELDWQGQRRARIREMLGHLGREAGDEAELDASFSVYLDHYEAGWRAFPDAAPAIEQVRGLGLHLAVLTNGAEQQQRAKLAAIGLAGAVGPLFSSDAIGSAKPDPRAYLHVCAALSTEPRRTLHLGDRYDLDVIAARRAGLQAVHLDRTGAGPLGEAYRITSLSELPARLAQPVK